MGKKEVKIGWGRAWQSSGASGSGCRGIGLAAGTVAAVCAAPSARGGVEYRVEFLSNLSNGGAFTYARAVNDAGVVIGDAWRNPPGVIPPVRWDANSTAPTKLGYLERENGYGWGINSTGDAVGYVLMKDNSAKPVRWSAGGTALAQLPGFSFPFVSAYAQAINDRDDVIGYSDTHPVRWLAGATAAVNLGMLGLGPTGNATKFAGAINSGGDGVGWVSDYVSGTGRDRAVLWRASGTSAVALPMLSGGALTNRETYANAINDDGLIAGTARMYSGFNLVESRAVRWSPVGASITDLGVGIANGINNAGDIVGSSSNHATLWPGDGTPAINLNDLIAPDSGWSLTSATDISNTGVIIGDGMFDPDGSGPLTSAMGEFRLTPIPEPGMVAVLTFASCAFGRTRRRRTLLMAALIDRR